MQPGSLVDFGASLLRHTCRKQSLLLFAKLARGQDLIRDLRAPDLTGSETPGSRAWLVCIGLARQQHAIEQGDDPCVTERVGLVLCRELGRLQEAGQEGFERHSTAPPLG